MVSGREVELSRLAYNLPQRRRGGQRDEWSRGSVRTADYRSRGQPTEISSLGMMVRRLTLALPFTTTALLLRSCQPRCPAPEVRRPHHERPCPKPVQHSTPSAPICPPMPCVQNTTGLCSATAPPAPAKCSAALRQTHPTSLPRAHYPCLANPVARSGLPPPEQNTCPPPGLFNMGLQCGFAHYESLYCSVLSMFP